MGSMHCVERQVEEERIRAVVAPDQLDRFVGQQEGRVAGLDDGSPVAVPIQSTAAKVREGLDLARVQPVVVVEPALQGQVL